ncbi:MAG TPA: hypothetical protein VLE69_03910 [Candidatus Saccharimonadales bacterium]|nr:hypothetical protein [Candidatus Saccharimonadales bacterium]
MSRPTTPITEEVIRSFEEDLQEVKLPLLQLEKEPFVAPERVANVQMKVGKRILPKALDENNGQA